MKVERPRTRLDQSATRSSCLVQDHWVRARLTPMGWALVLVACSDASLAPILAARTTPLIPSCLDGVQNGNETDVDCGGADCAPCDTGRSCSRDSDCTSPCLDGHCWLARTCADLHKRRPTLPTRVYSIDVDGPDSPITPFRAACDMDTVGGGWTRVGFEPAHSGGPMIEGALVYLGTMAGSTDAIADGTGAGLIGLWFAGAYHDVSVRWGDASFVRFTPARELFQNEVDLKIPVANFATSETLLNGWVVAASGASFCRASRFNDVRPGDTSWAIKPLNSTGSACGCNDPVWLDRGAFYGGAVPHTNCYMDRGGGWSGVQDVDAPKAGLQSTVDLSIWVR